MSIIIIKAGIMDNLQDAGRTGFAQLGINPNGPMDWYAHQLANALVGNPLHLAVIEMHFPPLAIHFTSAAIISITGADFEAQINGLPVDVNRTIEVPQGAELFFRRKKSGERAYLAISGGLDLTEILGSTATNLASGFGGWKGRKLQAGDIIALKQQAAINFERLRMLPWKAPGLSTTTNIRVMEGPEFDWLTEAARQQLFETKFILMPQSDRMALRWKGASLAITNKASMISSPVVMGTMQVLPGGELLTLMADHQTVGGYPRVLQAIKADLPLLAQLSPSRSVRFIRTSPDEALQALEMLHRQIAKLACALRFQLAEG